MKKYSLYTVLFASLFLLSAIFISAIFLSVRYQRNELIKTAIDEKVHFAKTISDTISSPAWKFRVDLVPGVEQNFIYHIGQFPDSAFLRIVDIKGNIRRSSIEAEVGQTIEDPDLVISLKEEKTIIKDEIYEGEEIKLIIYPSTGDNTVWVGFSLKGIEEAINRAIIQNISISTGTLLLILFIIYLTFRSIINPLRRLTGACEEVRRGNLDVKTDVKSKTEIGELADAFNQMIGELKKTKELLDEEKASLEIKVKARTLALEEERASLEEKVKERTKELQKRLEELERFNRLVLGRELKMVELKKEIKELKEKLPKKQT